MTILFKKKIFIFLIISLLFHICIFLILPSQLPLLAPLEDIPVQIEENHLSENKSSIIDQNFFNHQDPINTPYYSKYNNIIIEEQKGKIRQSFKSSLNKKLDVFNDSNSSTSFSDELPNGYTSRIDYLKDIEKEGDENLLNTKKMWFYSFYSRVKEQIYWHWVRELNLEFTLAKSKEILKKHPFITQLAAYIDHKGRLISVKIRKKSGFDILDLAAVNAIKKAHPFSNPPKDLISDDGSIRLEYTFAVNE